MKCCLSYFSHPLHRVALHLFSFYFEGCFRLCRLPAALLAFLWLQRAGAALRLRCTGRGLRQLRLPSSRAQARQLRRRV